MSSFPVCDICSQRCVFGIMVLITVGLDITFTSTALWLTLLICFLFPVECEVLENRLSSTPIVQSLKAYVMLIYHNQTMPVCIFCLCRSCFVCAQIIIHHPYRCRCVSWEVCHRVAGPISFWALKSTLGDLNECQVARHPKPQLTSTKGKKLGR